MKCEFCGHEHEWDVTCYEYNTPNPKGGVLTNKHWYCRKCQKSVIRTYDNGVELKPPPRMTTPAELYPEDLNYDS